MTDIASKNGPKTSPQEPMQRLKTGVGQLGQNLLHRGISTATDRMESWTSSLTDVAEGNTKTKVAANVATGDSPVKAAVKGAASSATDKVKGAVSNLTGKGGGSSHKLKVTNILEHVDVPLPVDVAYDQWTRFEDFPRFMKKVENVSQEKDEKLAWKAQIFWSHRSWTATILDQVPGQRIVWKSDGEKGHVDGAITFHELSPNLTRILMVLEYHPKGLFEHTGNIWRAQGRRARLELKHFARHASTQTLLHQDEVKGWPGEIHEAKVTSQDARAEQDGEQGASNQQGQGQKQQGQAQGQQGQGQGQQGQGQGQKQQGQGQGQKQQGQGQGQKQQGQGQGQKQQGQGQGQKRQARTPAASTSGG